MRMTTLTLAAAFIASAASAASACGWNKETVAHTPVDTSKLVKPVDVASAPVDAWLIKYLEDWKKA